jgi:hypothetical protein
MVRTTPAPELPDGLVDLLLVGPVLRPDRIAAGRRRAAGAPVDAIELADAVVADGWLTPLRV